MTRLYFFNLYHIEYSIIVNHFRQYFDKIYCLVLRLTFVLIVWAFCSTYLTLDRDNPGIGLIHFVKKNYYCSALLEWLTIKLHMCS